MFHRKAVYSYGQLFILMGTFFEHEEWLVHGRVLSSWDVTDASVNGQAYIPHGFSSQALQRWLLRSYMQFYLRPSKLFQLSRTIRNRDDITRHWRGVSQIIRHIRASDT